MIMCHRYRQGDQDIRIISLPMSRGYLGKGDTPPFLFPFHFLYPRFRQGFFVI